MSIVNIKTAIKTSIESALSIKCYTSVQASPNPPCAYILPKSGDYKVTLPMQKMQLELDVVLLLQRGDSLEDVQDTMDTYLLPTGSGSMKAAIDAAILSTDANFLRVNGFSEYGVIEFGGVTFLGCKWHITVII